MVHSFTWEQFIDIKHDFLMHISFYSKLFLLEGWSKAILAKIKNKTKKDGI